jgi:hypothetical protein
MVRGFTLILLGLASTVVLAFVSHRAKSVVVRMLFWTALAVAGCVIVYSRTENIRSERSLHNLSDKSDYFEVSRCNPAGLPFREGKGIRYDTPLATELRDCYVIPDSTINFKLGQQFESRYTTVISQFPRFPFGYFALAESMRQRGDPAWREFAQKAISILEKTTAIEGHDPSHDDALATLRGYLASK